MDNEVIERFAKIMNRDINDVENLFDGLVNVIKENLVDMNSIALPGFGTFTPVKKEEHIGEDDGKKILYPPEMTVEFSSSALLRRKISEREGE